MKDFLKGILLGISLIIANKLCCYLFNDMHYSAVHFSSGLVFFLITCGFLVSKSVGGLLLCGFCGLFVMFFGEIFSFSYTSRLLIEYSDYWFDVYIGGFFGSMAALVVAVILTVKQIKISKVFFREVKFMNNNENEFYNDLYNYTPVITKIKETPEIQKKLKLKLLLYAMVSAISFSYLVMPENAGISVPLFTLIQFGCLWFVVPDRKKLILLIPVFIMSLNCFISGSHIWRVPNFIISVLIYCCMFANFDFKNDTMEYFTDILTRLFIPLAYFTLPFKWVLEINSEKAPVIKRVAAALIITIPCIIMLIFVLSSADMVFSLKTQNILDSFSDIFRFNTVYKGICGIIAGLFLFGIIYYANTNQNYKPENKSHLLNGDLIIINILLCSVLTVYTAFVIIQFRYLFSGSVLPDGLTYTEYARKGFFELLALTGINIAGILAAIKLTKMQKGKWITFTKFLCHYLCAVTVVLLISSFYRMFLYTNDDGLTRLRLFVMGFLIFEAAGLGITFLYIARPNINITLIYLCVALIYYMVLNLVPADNIIAKNQIDKYLDGEREDIEYIFTLSADAIPAMEYLYKNTDDEKTKENIIHFKENSVKSGVPERWQRYNLSLDAAAR